MSTDRAAPARRSPRHVETGRQRLRVPLPRREPGNPSASEGPVPRDASSSVSGHRRSVSRETAPPRAALRHVVPRETADGFAVSDTVLSAARSSHCTDIWLTARQPRDSLTQRRETVTWCPASRGVEIVTQYRDPHTPRDRHPIRGPARNAHRGINYGAARATNSGSSHSVRPTHAPFRASAASLFTPWVTTTPRVRCPWSPRRRTGPVPAVRARFT